MVIVVIVLQLIRKYIGGFVENVVIWEKKETKEKNIMKTRFQQQN